VECGVRQDKCAGRGGSMSRHGSPLLSLQVIVL
jgi:hypothetical protein